MTQPAGATPYAPAPAASGHFIPVDITFTVFRKGEAPQSVTERRHMTFTVHSFRAMCDGAGIDRDKMADQQRLMAAQRDHLIKTFGEKEGLKRLTAEAEKRARKRGAMSAVLPMPEGMPEEEQIEVMIWGALLAEDAALNGGRIEITREQVRAALTSQEVLAVLFEPALDALIRYLTGKGTKQMAEEAERARQEAEEGEEAAPEDPSTAQETPEPS